MASLSPLTSPAFTSILQTLGWCRAHCVIQDQPPALRLANWWYSYHPHTLPYKQTWYQHLGLQHEYLGGHFPSQHTPRENRKLESFSIQRRSSVSGWNDWLNFPTQQSQEMCASHTGTDKLEKLQPSTMRINTWGHTLIAFKKRILPNLCACKNFM